MQLSSMAARAVLCAASALACASCAGQSKNHTDVTVAWSAEPQCAATVPGAKISLLDAPEGATILFETGAPEQVDVMRAEAHQQVQAPLQARASGGSPLHSEQLPAVRTQITPQRRGVSVTFTAVDPKDTERLRAMIWSDVRRQQRGECSQLRLPSAAGYASPSRANQGWKLSLSGIDLDPVLADACGISASQTFVAFDSAEPHKGDTVALETLAACVASGRYSGGPLQIRSYSPADNDEFSRLFDRTRAEAVAQWLHSLGIDNALLRVTRSEDHSPTEIDDRGWQWSRRVSISPAR